jgi:TonB family protein
MQWTLYGRGVKALPKPSNDFTQEGEVVVQIYVDKDGNVTSAKAIHEGTTISDVHTQKLAERAAWQAKFTSGERPQVGKIVYKFKLN